MDERLYRHIPPMEQLSWHAQTGDVKVLGYWLKRYGEWFAQEATETDLRQKADWEELLQKWSAIDAVHGVGAALNIDDESVRRYLRRLPKDEMDREIGNAEAYKRLNGQAWLWYPRNT
ncbi:hypothetical protein FHT87_005899 [Rhizobium sp. BK316]|uniref:hypothetical protein n=1 Tax=Rhizobium sp. BK316 TaxID=2587053 RepID=UPI00160CA9B0|nr:hypothetical protein [Rhizobium sp. BK316]MBB3411932.1 hypothetical protein [Rhizobium sp. BK316]